MRITNVSTSFLYNQIPDGYVLALPKCVSHKAWYLSALLRNQRTGIYVLYNAGMLHSCDQQKAADLIRKEV